MPRRVRIPTLVQTVVVVTGVMAVSLVLLQAYATFTQGETQRDRTIAAIETSYLDAVAAAVFFFEADQLQRLADGMVELPYVDAVEIYEYALGEHHLLLQAGEANGGFESFDFQLQHVYGDEVRLIGQLVVRSDPDQLRAQVLDGLRRTAVGTVLALLAVATLTWWLVSRSLYTSSLERKLEDNAKLLSMAASVARIGGWEADLAAGRVYWSDEVCRIHDMPPGSTVSIDDGIRYYAPEYRERITEVFTACTRDGRPFDEELEILTATGRRVSVRSAGEAVRDDRGRVIRVVGAFVDVTASRRAQQRLERSEATLRAITEASPDPILMSDDEGTLVFCNQATQTILGYPPEALIGRAIHEVIAPLSDHDAATAGLERFAASGTGPVVGSRNELLAVHHDGHTIVVELSVAPLSLDGRWHAVAVMRDITARKHVEGQLSLQAKRAEALLELPRVAERLDEPELMQWGQEIAENLTQSRIAFIHFVHADQETIELITWSRRTLSDYCEVVEPDRHYPLSAAGIWADAARTRCPIVVNDYASHPGRRGMPDGHAELRRMVCVPVLEHGRVTMLAGVGNKDEDYTDTDVETVQLIADQIWATVQRRRTTSRLRQLSLAVEQSPDSVVITNLAAEIEYVNEAFLTTSGYTRDEVIGQNPRFLQSGKTPQRHYDALWTALSKGEAWQGEFYNRRKDGTEYVEYGYVAPLRREDGESTHYVAVKQDITERKRIGLELDQHRHHLEDLIATRTEELVQARHQAEAANVAKSAFLANMSHEIRTPINAIVGLTHILQRDTPTPEQHERLTKIEGAANHLLTIISDILDLAKIESGRLSIEEQDFELNTVVDAVHAIIAETAHAKGLNVTTNHHNVPPRLRGDPTRLRQALLNLASNAIKFTHHGHIHLHTELLNDDGDSLHIRFSVHDTGIGIPPERQPDLFNPFEQLDPTITRQYGGTGLGLAITKHLAELMGGTVGIQSQPGHGTHIWFTAHLTRSHNTTPTPHQPPDIPTTTRTTLEGAHILLAEDNDINREVATDLLRGFGATVTTAENGRIAVNLTHHNTYDLILMDVQMPELDGLTATREIRTNPTHDTTPILAMTANVFEDDRRACLAAGMDGFIGKPMAPPDLRKALNEWLEHGREHRTRAP